MRSPWPFIKAAITHRTGQASGQSPGRTDHRKTDPSDLRHYGQASRKGQKNFAKLMAKTTGFNQELPKRHHRPSVAKPTISKCQPTAIALISTTGLN